MKKLILTCALVAVAVAASPAGLAHLTDPQSGVGEVVIDAASLGLLPQQWSEALQAPDAVAGRDTRTGSVGVAGSPQACTDRGSAVRGDVAAAVAAVTTDDDGRGWGVMRWEQPRVGVTVTGDLAEEAAGHYQVDATLAWMSATTGIAFERGGEDLVIELVAGSSPHGSGDVVGGVIQRATVQWDPSHPHACRWAFEEVAQVSGVPGDHGPAGSILSTDQSALGPSDFDAWVLSSLYRADGRDVDALRRALAHDH